MAQIGPQPGPQTEFLSTAADIAVYGGAAGGGKSFAVLLEPLRHVSNPRFSFVGFRRTNPEIVAEGGLWEESSNIYPAVGAKPKPGDLKWVFPSKATGRFSHMQHEDDKLKWQGSQIPLILFDELTHFTEGQFFYLLSRNRTMCGVKPYMRATCNPDATSWVKRFLAPWLDKTYPLQAKSGEILWMFRDAGVISWYRTYEEAYEDNRAKIDGLITILMDALEPGDPIPSPRDLVKSVTFIFANVYDNKKLLAQNPGYLGNLLALPPVEQARLLYGDWDALPEAGKVIDRSWFELVEAVPVGRVEPIPLHRLDLSIEQLSRMGADRSFDVRFWDLAATEKKQKGSDPDWTVGVRMRRHRGKYYVVDVHRGRYTPGALEQTIYNIAVQDHAEGFRVPVRWEEEGGASGKISSNTLMQKLAGFDALPVRPSGDKVTRAMPWAAQAHQQNVKLKVASWNEAFLVEAHHFPDIEHDDQVDATSGAFAYLVKHGVDVTVGPDIWSS